MLLLMGGSGLLVDPGLPARRSCRTLRRYSHDHFANARHLLLRLSLGGRTRLA